MLNKSKGNMYPFVTHTWNTVKGKCPHGCSYCYMKRFGEQPELHFDEKELKTDLGSGNFIFVGSSCDMFAVDVEYEWVKRTLEHCRKFENLYLFQTKNPGAFIEWQDMEEMLPLKTVLGTTIESNRWYAEMGRTLAPWLRATCMEALTQSHVTMITIEPIMDFDLMELGQLVHRCQPLWVNIGADSRGHGLPEPSGEKVRELIAELERFTEVKIKDNLKRILNQ